MFGILAKFFRFSGRENGNKFKLSIVIGLIEALASAMKFVKDTLQCFRQREDIMQVLL